MTAPGRTAAAGLAAAAVKLAVGLPFLERYGWHRDELYFLAAGRHPALGYVDFPPVTAWIAWLVDAVAGPSLGGLRLTAQATGVAAIVLVAFVARELGASLRVQLVAALAFAVTPYALAFGSIFHTTVLDAVPWIALMLVLLRILGRPEPRLWPLAGVIAGVGLQTKYTILALIGAIFLALAVSDGRPLLRTRGPWLAAGIALLLWAPNLIWQQQHAWVSVDFFSSQHADTASDTGPASFVAEGVAFLGAATVLAAIGVVSLWRRPRLRPLALVPVIVTAVFFLEQGRSYYPLPADAVPIAAGVVALAEWARRRRAVAAAVALCLLHGAVLAVALPVVVPIYSTRHMVSSRVWDPGFYDDEIGWPQLVATTARAWHGLPASERAHAAILAQNYGEAGALALFGPRDGLPPPVSGHLSWQFWRPERLPQTVALTVGYDGADLDTFCSSHHVLAVIDNPYRLPNEERGRTVQICTLDAPLGTLWQDRIVRSTL